MKESWKPIEGTDGKYEVSTFGRVKSNCGRQPRILKQKFHRIRRKCGDTFYRTVSLRFGGEYHHYMVHRLVAEAFIPNPQNHPIINHKDENPQNNRVDNLEWCTHSYNASYGDAQNRRLNQPKCESDVILPGKPKPNPTKCIYKTKAGHYEAYATHNRKSYNLGTYRTFEEAVTAREKFIGEVSA